jgi:hypothetical protein
MKKLILLAVLGLVLALGAGTVVLTVTPHSAVAECTTSSC